MKQVYNILAFIRVYTVHILRGGTVYISKNFFINCVLCTMINSMCFNQLRKNQWYSGCENIHWWSVCVYLLFHSSPKNQSFQFTISWNCRWNPRFSYYCIYKFHIPSWLIHSFPTQGFKYILGRVNSDFSVDRVSVFVSSFWSTCMVISLYFLFSHQNSCKHRMIKYSNSGNACCAWQRTIIFTNDKIKLFFYCIFVFIWHVVDVVPWTVVVVVVAVGRKEWCGLLLLPHWRRTPTMSLVLTFLVALFWPRGHRKWLSPNINCASAGFPKVSFRVFYSECFFYIGQDIYRHLNPYVSLVVAYVLIVNTVLIYYIIVVLYCTVFCKC